MPDIILNAGGKNYRRVSYLEAASSGLVLSLNTGAVTSAAAKLTTNAPASNPLSGAFDEIHLKTNVANAFSLSGVTFSAGGKNYIVKASGDVQTDLSTVTGNGTSVGTMTPLQGEVKLLSWAAGMAPQASNFRGVAAAPVNGVDTPYATYGMTFRTSTAPLKVNSVSILGTMQDGTTFNVSANSDGVINATRIKGRVNYNTGVIQIVGVTPTAPGQTLSDLSFLKIPGLTTGYVDLIRAETVRYNAVAYTYLPLNAELLGIDPVRLPSDGRVPIFRAADVYVIGNDQTTTPATAANGGTVDTGRTRLSRVRVIGNDDATIEAGYTVDYEAGIVTWVDVTGYSQPVRVEHRIEDMAQIRDGQIDGTITGLKALTHDYPVEGTYVSSALMAGDLSARVQALFDLASWDGTTWSDATGTPASATYDDINHPIIVRNDGAVTERWGIKFTTTQAFQIFGEHLGLVGTGSINTVTEPLNPVNGQPYFSIPILGWGGGGGAWSIGNALRFNTVAAGVQFWEARTIKQGPNAGEDYSFTTLARGNVDNPL